MSYRYALPCLLVASLLSVAACAGDTPLEVAQKRMSYLHDTIRPLHLTAADISERLGDGSPGLQYTFRGEGTLTPLAGQGQSIQMFDRYVSSGFDVAYWQDFGPDVPVSDRPSTVVSSVAVYDSEAGAAEAQSIGPALYASVPLYPAYEIPQLFSSITTEAATPDSHVWVLHGDTVVDYAVLDIRVGRLIGALIFEVAAGVSPADRIYLDLIERFGEKLSPGVPDGFSYPP